MTDDALGLAAVYGAAYAVNAVPGLMPPTSIVVALLIIQLDLPVLPAALGAVIAAGFGRLTIARYATYARRWLEGRSTDLEALRERLESHQRALVVTSSLYSIALPTNVLFAAAGLSGAQLRWILAGYWLARIPIDGGLIWAGEAITRDLLVDALRSPIAIALQLGAIVLFLVMLRLPWARWATRSTAVGSEHEER